MANAQPLSYCPFCSFEDVDADFTLQHINLVHPENEDAPYIGKPRQEPTRPSPTEPEGSTDWIECPCGDFCMITEIQQHIDLHEAENTDFNDIEIHGADVIAASRTYDRTVSFSNMASLAFGHSIPSANDMDTFEFSEQSESTDSLAGLNQQQLPNAANGMRLSSQEPTETDTRGIDKSRVFRLGVCCLHIVCNFALIGDLVSRPWAAPY